MILFLWNGLVYSWVLLFAVVMLYKAAVGRANDTNKPKQSWKKKEQSQGYHVSWFQATLQRYCKQNSMVLAYKQTQRSVEQNRESRSKSTHILSINLQKSSHEYMLRKGNGAG